MSRKRKWSPCVGWMAVACLSFSIDAHAQFDLVRKAQPDEFYTGLGQAYIPLGEQAPDQVGQPKVNQDYLWGMATDGRFLWFGTGGNAAALAGAQTSLGGDPPDPVEEVSDSGVPYRAWEYGLSQYPGVPLELRSYLGDFRPPQIFQYDARRDLLVDRTPNDPKLGLVAGLRSAGVSDGVALLAGPSLYQIGIYLFAFDVNTGRYLGSAYIPQYSNIRRWIVARGQLYTAVANTNQDRVRGSVLKWVGNHANPFQFSVVGHLDNEGSYLAYHDDRLFVGTWPSYSAFNVIRDGEIAPRPVCGVWMSPKLSLLRGLWSFQAEQWQKVWDPSFYEPEPTLQLAYSMGAMESYGGALYFGTLHFPGQGAFAFQEFYGFPAERSRFVERRPIIVRAKGYGSAAEPTVELLYGDAVLPTFQPDGMGGGTWMDAPNAHGSPGLYGGAGFGNRDNRYIWSSTVHAGKLYLGTFDVSGISDIDDVIDGAATSGVGADLWAFPAHGEPAMAVSLEGCGNPANHGVRNMVTTPFGLYLGTANSANLLTDPNDDLPDGGWELLRLMQ